MKKFLYPLLFFFVIQFHSQNKQVLYNFAELPQTLLLNPGAETNYKFHVGVPLLSGISTDFSSSKVVLTDLFLKDGRSINNKITEVLSTLRYKDHLKFNSQIEVLNVGYKYNKNLYFSFGFYEEIDAIAYFPTDIITLLNEGNGAYLNRSFNLSQLSYKVDVLGVLHAGVTKKVNEKLTVGARLKIYSSAFNFESTNNSGSFTTTEGTNNILAHYFNDVDVTIKSSGVVKDDKYIDTPKTYIKNTFFGSNMGIGLDVGLTYHISPQLEFTGSIIDFGFINHKKNIKNFKVKGSYTFEGIEFLYDNSNPDYWKELNDDFEEKLQNGDNYDSYVSWRPTKINAGLKYSFGEKRSKYCYGNTYKDFYNYALGVQLFSVFRPLNHQLALTGFFEKSFSEKIHAKVTYTMDDYSLYNIGAGISAQFGKVNIYGMVDNIAKYTDITASNSISLQLGINLIFN